jgi:capsular exopolysaccharide synthesis family protein
MRNNFSSTEPTPRGEGDLREYLRVVRVRKVEILLITAVVVATALVLSFRQTPIYEAQSRVLVNPTQTIATTVGVAQQPNLDTERQQILSRVVATRVQRALHTTQSGDQLLRHVAVDVVTDTTVLVVRYDSPDPQTAARLSNAFANAYIDYRIGQAQGVFTRAATALQRRIDDLQHKIAALGARIRAAKEGRVRDSLQAQQQSLAAQIGVLQQQMLTLQSNATSAQQAAQVIQPAAVPSKPARPDKVRDGVVALFLGLALGVGFAFVRERLDNRIKSRGELEERLGAPVLASVPRVGGWTRRDNTVLVVRSDPKSPVAEAYGTLAANVQHAASLRDLQVVMVTSGVGSEGKTTTACNLALILARTGRRVILVSADLRRPRVHKFFGLANDAGLVDILEGRLPLERAVSRCGEENLRIVDAGPPPHDPVQLLGGGRAARAIGEIRSLADFVIVDSPPVLAVADASILAPVVDATLFVVDADTALRSVIDDSRAQLERAGATLLGAVYNNFDPRRDTLAYTHYRGYYAEYASEVADDDSGNGSTPNGRSRLRSPRRGSLFGSRRP